MLEWIFWKTYPFIINSVSNLTFFDFATYFYCIHSVKKIANLSSFCQVNSACSLANLSTSQEFFPVPNQNHGKVQCSSPKTNKTPPYDNKFKNLHIKITTLNNSCKTWKNFLSKPELIMILKFGRLINWSNNSETNFPKNKPSFKNI